MISHQLKASGGRRRPWRHRPLVLAVFSFRYDYHLVPDLLANLEPIVDGWVSFDDRNGREAYFDEPKRRRVLIDTARALGAEWVLAVDPDERFEAGLAGAMQKLTASREPTAWSFNLREMYTPDAYRVDGLWDKKRQVRLFSMYEAQDLDDQRLHGQWFPRAAGHRLRHSRLNLYHLRMISPARRQARRALYNALDPKKEQQAIGYDYLVDEQGIRLEQIERERGYDPPHRDDGGLWSVSPQAMVATGRGTAFTESGGGHAARRGVDTQALADAASSLPVHDSAPELAVVVIGLDAPPELVDAVRSVLDQPESTEILVVNSGGGDAAGLLADAGIDVPVFETAERLFAGAARNVGIRKTTAPWIAFLASDCLAEPGWVAERMRLHREGHGMVASALLPSRRDKLVAWAHHLLLFPNRLPGLPASAALRYGVSFERTTFNAIGLFDESLRTGEDTEFLSRVPAGNEPTWAPSVVTLHRNADNIWSLVRDQIGRGYRYAGAMRRVRGTSPADLLQQALRQPRRSRQLVKNSLTGRDRELAMASLWLVWLGSLAKVFGMLIAFARQTGVDVGAKDDTAARPRPATKSQ